jgi:HEAT repeat protein
MKIGRTEDASVMIEVLMAEGSEESGKGDELIRYASEALTTIMGPDGVIDIESLLLEENDVKRKKTVQALARLGPAALAPLVDMVKDRGQVELRDRALEAIQMAGEPGIKALLGELEKDNPWYIYRNVLNVVADLKLIEGLPQVTAMVSNPDERIRREAVRSLARIGSRDSLDAVKGAAADQSIAVRRTAVRVLGMFGDSSVALFLLDIINGQGLRGKDEDQGVIESTCLALGDLRNKEYVPQLAELLGKGGLFKKGRPDEIRAAACIALGNVGDQSAVPVLEKAAKYPSVMVRNSAEKALRRLEGEVTSPELASPGEAELVTGASDPLLPPLMGQVPLHQPPVDYAPVGQPSSQEVPAPAGQEPPAGQVYDSSTLEGMILGTETPEAAPPLPAEGQASGVPGMDASTLGMIAEEETLRPAKLTLEPPTEPADAQGHVPGSVKDIPQELSDLWPKGSLNGHDYPVPPPPAGVSSPQGEEPPLDGLPHDDFAPGRTDQPSTMERLLGPGEAPPAQMPDEPAPPPERPPRPPASPPPASGWK